MVSIDSDFFVLSPSFTIYSRTDAVGVCMYVASYMCMHCVLEPLYICDIVQTLI